MTGKGEARGEKVSADRKNPTSYLLVTAYPRPQSVFAEGSKIGSALTVQYFFCVFFVAGRPRVLNHG